MNEKIASLEKELMEKKPWQLQGEVTAQKRPENSLLEETLHFDHAVRMGMVPAGLRHSVSMLLIGVRFIERFHVVSVLP
jgi:U3 small nucleolar ribonucleoprotein component